MVFIKNFLCVFKVEVVFGIFIPRQLYNVFKVIVLDTIFSHLRIHSLEFTEFFLESLFNIIRPFFLSSLFFKDFDIYLIRSSAEFFLDGSQLLVKEIFALLLVHIHLNLILNLMFQFKHLHVISQDCEQFCSECRYIIYFKQSLFILH